MKRLALATLCLPILGACSSVEQVEQREPPPSRLVEGVPLYTLLPLDGIPAIDEPLFVDVEQASLHMADDEPVIGVVGQDGTAKCYSAWHLDVHEIVNDTLDGKPIAVTW